jgi:hypothetical protein
MGAGVGSGFADEGTSSVGVLNVRDGVFSVVGRSGGAGIGAGRALLGNSSILNLTISAGRYSSISDEGAGIGCGAADFGSSSISSLTIENGVFDIVSSNAAGIGTGRANHGESTIATLSIKNGFFTVWAQNGAAIGTGPGESGRSAVANLTIEEAVINATASGAAGIGSIITNYSASRILSLTVLGESIIATAPIGIGGNVGQLQFGSSGIASYVHLECSSALSCLSAPSVVATDVGLDIVTNTSTLFDYSLNMRLSFHAVDLYSQYLHNSWPELDAEMPMLHIASIGGIHRERWTPLIIRPADPEGSIRIEIWMLQGIQGFAVSLPNSGDFEIESRNGHICHNNSRIFSVGNNESYFEEANLCHEPMPPDELAMGAVIGAIAGVTMLLLAVVVFLALFLRRRYLLDGDIVNAQGLLLAQIESGTINTNT